MLRLSEAFARLHCCEEVTARHVKEAYRLLNKSISFLIIEHIRRKEAETESSQEEKDSAPTKSQVIAWYLDEIGNDIETEDELIEQKQVIEKVVDKLIYQDQVIVPLSNSAKGSAEEDPFLVVHPNYCYSDA